MTPFLQQLLNQGRGLFPEPPEPPKTPEALEPSALPTTPAPAGAVRTAVEPVPTAAPGLGCRLVEYGARGYHLDVVVLPSQVLTAVQWLDQQGFTLDAVTGVDWIAENQMEVVYDFFHASFPARVAVRARLPRDNPEVPTISGLFPGANWHERETHDFFGIRFLGHPNLTPLLLPEDADFHPLRKDFAP